MLDRGAVAEWLMAAVLKTAGRKPRGFESLPLRQLHPSRLRRRDATRSQAQRRHEPSVGAEQLPAAQRMIVSSSAAVLNPAPTMPLATARLIITMLSTG